MKNWVVLWEQWVHILGLAVREDSGVEKGVVEHSLPKPLPAPPLLTLILKPISPPEEKHFSVSIPLSEAQNGKTIQEDLVFQDR